MVLKRFSLKYQVVNRYWKVKYKVFLFFSSISSNICQYLSHLGNCKAPLSTLNHLYYLVTEYHLYLPTSRFHPHLHLQSFANNPILTQLSLNLQSNQVVTLVHTGRSYSSSSILPALILYHPGKSSFSKYS